MIKFKNASEVRWYLYRSREKIRMLYQQIASSSPEKKTLEWKVNIAAASFSGKREREESVDEEDMLNAICRELDDRGQVGTIDDPKPYIRGVLPMRWGLYNDFGFRPVDDGPLVYFGGLDKDASVLLALGGSTKHVIGHEGATSTHSRSCTRALVTALLSGIEVGQYIRHSLSLDPLDEEGEIYRAMAIAQRYLRPPTQNLEFFAKTLIHGHCGTLETYLRSPVRTAILATPLFVALSAPYPADDLWEEKPDL